MRKKIVAGNWKMNCTHEEAVALANERVELLKNEKTQDVTIILATPYVHLGIVRYLTDKDSRIRVAAQNCAAFDSGAYTGEVSASMIKSVAADLVIIGHSERRIHFNESNAAGKHSLNVKQATILQQ